MALCLCFFVGTAKADVGDVWKEGDVWYKVVRAGELAVVRDTVAQSYTGTITVPATVTHDEVTYTVKHIADHAFAYPDGTPPEDTDIEYVNLPSTIVSLGNCTFQWCASLKSIVIPNLVTVLWDDDFDGVNDAIGATFMGCIGLEEVTIGAGITDMAAPNGLFNNNAADWASSLKKFTCLATTPPTMNDNTFMLGVDDAVLFVPAGSEDAYRTAVVNTIWNWTHGEAANVYADGTCVPPWSPATTQGKDVFGDDYINITWKGVATAYNVIISQTELDSTALAGATATGRTTDLTYDAIYDVEGNGNYYVYIQGDCGDGNTSAWVSASFYYYSGTYCEYIMEGCDYSVGEDPYVVTTYGWYGSHVQIVQDGAVIADVTDPLAGKEISLIPNLPATFKWIGSGQYSSGDGDLYPCWFRVKDAAGNVLIQAAELYGDSTFAPVNIDCSSSGIKRLDINNASITPTLSAGFVTVTAEVGSIAKVTDLTGRLLKSERITGANQKVDLNYTNGVYLITLENGNSRFVRKVILKR